MILENEETRRHSSLPGVPTGADSALDQARTKTWVPRPRDGGKTGMTWTTRARQVAEDVKRRFQGGTRRVDGRKLRALLRRYQRPLIAVAAAVVLLAFFVLGGGEGDSVAGDGDADSGISMGSPAEVFTMCGSEDATPPRRVDDDAWLDYSCQSRREASRWGACLKRSQYSRDRSMGCPGKQRCCPAP